MSDFTSNFWSVYVAGITIVSIVACLLLLWMSGKARAMTASDNTTGHIWDGDLREMNNPLPRWWVGLFILTIAFAGFPNLTDNAWLHGGTPDKIKETITKGRVGNMPPMAAAVGSADDVRNVAQYVLSLSNSPHDSVRAELGKPKFAVCAACHGADGKGNIEIGSANLTDDIWLHGWGEEAIVRMVNQGKTNVMPAQEGKLTTSQIHVLTAYIWGLSNNKPGGATAKP